MEKMWLARDKSEILFLYISNYEPKKEDECWSCCGGDCIALDGSLFPEVKWCCSIFSHFKESERFEDYFICMLLGFNYCIPYNDETKHLARTTEEAPEYYRYWED